MKRKLYIAVFLLSILLCGCAKETEPAEAPSTPAPVVAPIATPEPTPLPTPTPPPTPSPEELLFLSECEDITDALKDLAVGDIFCFGCMEQDGNDENGAEPIEWQVLDRQDNRLFVISRYVLDLVAYHDTMEDVTWETSSMRRWLNGEFYDNSFSEAEKSFIPLVLKATEDNPFVLTDGGNDTEDYLTLPSINELHTFLSWQPLRQTQYAFNMKSGWYWLRNMGLNHLYPSYISYDGSFNYTPHLITEEAGVRPVMYLDIR